MSLYRGIAARYDMPIRNEGDTGRIVPCFVEAGDHVSRARSWPSSTIRVLIPQVNRLAASLEQAGAGGTLRGRVQARAGRAGRGRPVR